MLRTKPTKATDLLFPLLVFLVVLGVYANSRVYQSSDSRWSLHLAASIVGEGNVDLDEYRGLMSFGDYRIRQIDHHIFSAFPIGAPLLTVPFLWLYRGADSLIDLDFGELSAEFEAFVASFFTSICIFVYYLICRKYLGVKRSLFLVFVYAFATSAWSTASRALWQHGPSMMMLCLTLYIVLSAEDRPWLIQFASLPLAYSFVIRPTNSISVLFLSLFIFFSYRKYIVGYLSLSMVIAIPFLLFNLVTYHSFVPPYYSPDRIGSNVQFFQALVGNLISPARGLFVFSPVLLLSFGGIVLKAKEGQLNKLDVTLIAAMVLHLVAVSSFPHWWGGHSFGPRFLTDILPYLMYFMIPAIGRMAKPVGTGGLAYVFSIALLTAFSFLVHCNGATNKATSGWNSQPVNVDKYPDRLWDWRDLQFLRGASAFDSLTAPRIIAEPDRILILCRSGEQYNQEVYLGLDNVRYRDFQWEAIPSGGVDVFPRRGEGATHFTLVIAVPETAYPPGRHDLGEIKVLTRAQGRFGVQGDSVSVPIELYVVDELHTSFLPFVSREFGSQDISARRIQDPGGLSGT